MRHRRSGLSTYGLNGLIEQEKEHLASLLRGHGTLQLTSQFKSY